MQPHMMTQQAATLQRARPARSQPPPSNRHMDHCSPEHRQWKTCSCRVSHTCPTMCSKPLCVGLLAFVVVMGVSALVLVALSHTEKDPFPPEDEIDPTPPPSPPTKPPGPKTEIVGRDKEETTNNRIDLWIPNELIPGVRSCAAGAKAPSGTVAVGFPRAV